ncbi:MAG: ImmA/IrrE family metallo-endopeptidase [Spirochaetota bacterium]
MMSQFKVIKTEAEYKKALALFEQMLEVPEDERDYDNMELLSVLIERYEEEHYPIVPPDPIDAIKFRMEQAGLNQKDLVPYFGSPSKVSEVLSGKRDLTLSMIRALSKHLGLPAEVLIREPQKPLPQTLADLDFSRFPIKAMEKNGAFSGFPMGKAKISEKTEEAIRWLIEQIGDFSAIPQIALRKNDEMRLNAKLDKYALFGWCLQVLHEASKQSPLGRFTNEVLTDRFIQTLVSLSVIEDGPCLAREYLSKAGISLLAVPHLPQTYLDGAVFLTEDKQPIIALTLRYDRIDNFWFVLLHELGHLKLGHLSGERSWIADDLKLASSDSLQEKEADDFAASALLPSDFDLDTKLNISSNEVISYARAHGIHPAIVAGRIQYKRKNFRILANLVGRGEVRKHFPIIGTGWSKKRSKEEDDI